MENLLARTWGRGKSNSKIRTLLWHLTWYRVSGYHTTAVGPGMHLQRSFRTAVPFWDILLKLRVVRPQQGTAGLRKPLSPSLRSWSEMKYMYVSGS